LRRAAFAFALCAAFTTAVYYFINIYAAALSLCAVGFAFSRIIIDFFAELGWVLHTKALEGVSGHHYQYLGFHIQIREDEDGCRWIPVDDLRRIVGNLASDNSLAHRYPSGFERMGKPEIAYLRDDALMTHLAEAPSARSIKFKNWAERNIAFPARKTRKSRGKYLGDATATKLE